MRTGHACTSVRPLDSWSPLRIRPAPCSGHAVIGTLLIGEQHEIIKASAAWSVYTLNAVSIARVRHALYANAKLASVTLPPRLTVDPRNNKRAHDDWQREIRAYQAAAGARIARALLKA